MNDLRIDRDPPSSESGVIAENPPAAEGIAALRYSWRDPATIPTRQFLFGRHYVRKAVGATVAAGGRGKTTLAIIEAISMAVGRHLLTSEATEPLRVWYLNGEEDQDELDRRIAATCQHYGIAEADCGGRLFVQSVRDKPIRLATLVKNIPRLAGNVINQLVREIDAKRIDVLMLDPFVSFHSLLENDNGHMDLVLKEALGAIVSRTNAAAEIFHHPGKPRAGQPETAVEDGRGASAILWAVRSARVLNFMTPDEAARLGIGEDDRRLHVRVANGKANMGPLGKASWFKLSIENLANGDQIAVASRWSPPDPFQGLTTADMELARKLAATGDYRADSRSPKWFGFALAAQLRLAVSHGADNDPKDIARLHAIIKTWLKNQVLGTEERKDGDGKDRKFMVAGSFRPAPIITGYPDDELTLQ